MFHIPEKREASVHFVNIFKWLWFIFTNFKVLFLFFTLYIYVYSEISEVLTGSNSSINCRFRRADVKQTLREALPL